MHLPGRVIDRERRHEGGAPGPGLEERAAAEVDRLRAAYEAPETDGVAVAELRRLLLTVAPPGTELAPASF